MKCIRPMYATDETNEKMKQKHFSPRHHAVRIINQLTVPLTATLALFLLCA